MAWASRNFLHLTIDKFVDNFSDNMDNSETFDDSKLVKDLVQGEANAQYIRESLILMAACHTVVPETDPNDPNNISYQASSPGIIHSPSVELVEVEFYHN